MFASYSKEVVVYDHLSGHWLLVKSTVSRHDFRRNLRTTMHIQLTPGPTVLFYWASTDCLRKQVWPSGDQHPFKSWPRDQCELQINRSTTLRPGKLNLLFRISHFLDLHAGWWSLFIASKCYFTLDKSTTIKSGHVIAWKAIMTVEVAGLEETDADAKQI